MFATVAVLHDFFMNFAKAAFFFFKAAIPLCVIRFVIAAIFAFFHNVLQKLQRLLYIIAVIFTVVKTFP